MRTSSSGFRPAFREAFLSGIHNYESRTISRSRSSTALHSGSAKQGSEDAGVIDEIKYGKTSDSKKGVAQWLKSRADTENWPAVNEK